MKYLFKLTALVLAAGLSACGGGGGSGGVSKQQYSISLKSDASSLPLNINPAQNGPGIGSYAPYTTTLYVSAKAGDQIVPESTPFACNLTQGLDSGAMYYLNGEDKETTDANGNKHINGSRSVALKSNAGTASFHFHAAEKAGVATITCSVTDPRDSKQYTSSVNITVGAATGKPAWIIGQTQASTVLGTNPNLSNLPSSVTVQASVYDDANQLIANPTASNLQVSIRPVGNAAIGATLVSGNQTGGVIQVPSSGGVAQFALRSGAAAGPILLELVTDRADNNVANGIQQPITSLLVVESVNEIKSSVPLTITSSAPSAATLAAPYSFLLQASGGNPPYKWVPQGILPPGLNVSPTGLISGTPSANVTGTYNFTVTVTDAVGQTATQNVALVVGGTPTYTPLSITLSGCNSTDVNTVCSLPNATSGTQYLYAFSATGGDPAQAVTWSATPAGTWLSMSTTGNTGVFSGTPRASTSTTTTDPQGNATTTVTPGQACGLYTYVVTATRGSLTTSRTVSVNLTGSAQQCAQK